ncbi:hypothetical protein DRQ25_10920, partial [Candidatus Fermentibacteria bacterium]
ERSHGLTTALTIGVNGNLCVSGPIMYEDIDLLNDSNRVMLGLVVKEGDFTIAVDPDMVVGMEDWELVGDPTNETWDISTCLHDYSNGIQVDAVIMVLDGYFQLEDVSSAHMLYWSNPAIDFEIVGGYIVNEEYVTTWVSGTETYGYLTFVTYDPRLMTMHPPYFPQTGVWDTAYWDERPDMIDVDDGTSAFIGYDAI